MKSIYLFSTKLWVYLTELPLIILLLLAISYNDSVKGLVKLYPLQILLVLGMIFILIYFFRIVRINAEEIRCIGWFSSRDSIIVKKDRRLKITLMKRGMIMLELFGIGESPELDWVDPEEYKNSEINLFRTKAVGSRRTLEKILSYFSIEKSDFDKILSEKDFSKEYEYISLSSVDTENGRAVSLKFKETI